MACEVFCVEHSFGRHTQSSELDFEDNVADLLK